MTESKWNLHHFCWRQIYLSNDIFPTDIYTKAKEFKDSFCMNIIKFRHKMYLDKMSVDKKSIDKKSIDKKSIDKKSYAQ
jgi:hypothetical protein